MNRLLVTILTMGVLLTPAVSTGAYVAPDNGGGTVDLPPIGSSYVMPDEVMEIIDGLPPGTTIEIDSVLQDYIEVTEVGGLGGHVQTYLATLELPISGTGALAGFTRIISMSVEIETLSGPRTSGNAVQDFDTEMVSMIGSIFGDPDFDVLTIRTGANLGLPSPGHTTLTRLGPPGSNFAVDSFFDVTYEIDFQGAPGSVLEGFGGTTMGTVSMEIIPEPATMSLLAIGGLALLKRRRK